MALENIQATSTSIERISASVQPISPPIESCWKLPEGLPVEVKDTWISRFIWGLEEYIECLEKLKQSKKVYLKNGIQILCEEEIGIYDYQFTLKGKAGKIQLDIPITLYLNNDQSVQGVVFRFIPKKKLIFIQVNEDLGERLEEAALTGSDGISILKALKKQFVAIQEKKIINFNQLLADAVLSNHSLDLSESTPPLLEAERLNSDQKAAALGALKNRVFYLWGPPGTGKTFTLTSVILSLCQAGKRVLICSNTHQAVDQVLLKLCNTLDKKYDHILKEGKILRIGEIEHVDLKKHKDSISIEGIVKRLSAPLIDEKIQLESRLQTLKRKYEELNEVHKVFTQVDSLKKAQQEIARRLSTTEAEYTKSGRIEKLEQYKEKIEKTSQALARYQAANIFIRLFLKKPNSLKNNLLIYESEARILLQKLLKIDEKIRKDRVEIRALNQKEIELSKQVENYSFYKVTEELDRLEKDKSNIQERLGILSEQLNSMKNRVLNDALVIGTTLATVAFRLQGLTDFDTVIIDEASMAMIPNLYYTAGLAKTRVIISGDFRQLHPIFESKYEKDEKDKLLEQLLATNIFKVAGISHAISAQKEVPRLQMLSVQYRMDAAICNLISGPMYHNALVTGERSIPLESSLPDWLKQPITIIDTSLLNPISTFDAGSKFNILHALIARQLALYLLDHNYTSFGICSSYRAQAQFITDLLETGDDDHKKIKQTVVASTVHKFQGDEKSLMIIDITDSSEKPLKVLGRFLKGATPEEEGARLYNVAISRAKQHIVFILNSQFLERCLQKKGILRRMLHTAGKSARWIEAQTLLCHTPQGSEERELVSNILGEEIQVYSEKQFVDGIKADLNNAKRSVAIFSGFITFNRVRVYRADFHHLVQVRKIKIRCVTRPPFANGSIKPEEGKKAIALLRTTGSVVDLRAAIHEKIVLLDQEILWIGSLNPLSYNENYSTELMVRIKSKKIALEVEAKLSLSHPYKKESFVDAENPMCEECGSLSVYQDKFKIYWTCSERDCQWKLDPKAYF